MAAPEAGSSSVKTVEIAGIDEFKKYYDNLKSGDSSTYFHFTGKKVNGVSWCPDCVEAEPVVKNCLNEVNKNITYVFVDVGDRDYWKNPQCPFRTDTRTKLMVIPTIIKHKGVQRLEGSQCCNPSLVAMLFEED